MTCEEYGWPSSAVRIATAYQRAFPRFAEGGAGRDGLEVIEMSRLTGIETESPFALRRAAGKQAAR